MLQSFLPFPFVYSNTNARTNKPKQYYMDTSTSNLSKYLSTNSKEDSNNCPVYLFRIRNSHTNGYYSRNSFSICNETVLMRIL